MRNGNGVDSALVPKTEVLNIDAETVFLLPGKYLAGYIRRQINISVIRMKKQ